MSTTMYFYNYSNEDFTWSWDKVPYTVPAGEKMLFPDYLAKHMAKHFVNREMMKDSKQTNHFSRQTYLDKCLFDGAPVLDKVQAEVATLNEKKKPGRPPKVKEEAPQFE